MKTVLWILLMLCGISPPSLQAMISPDSVALIYNSSVPESRELAEFYREARGIPQENLIGLEMPVSPDISRQDYEIKILHPLRIEFDRRGWWKREADLNGLLIPVSNRIRLLVTLKGVPLRIQPQPKQPGEVVKKSTNPTMGHDESAVDSELAMFGVEGLPVDGVLQNKYFQSKKSIASEDMPYLVLTARIDAPRIATCKRMIRDAIEVEKTGLWGWAYVDIANKYPQGDKWLESIISRNREAGVPTVVDRFTQTLPKHYPMTEASLYYGWYDWHVNGPFVNPRFKFRKGAVAMHLHSYSAEQLKDAGKNWSGALLEKGAAVTIGNVYEPYLHLTHDMGILHDRLLAGFSWVEACWMAMPVTSWQGVVIGDPLYQPFRHFDGSGETLDPDVEFRAIRVAFIEWMKNPRERERQLEKASGRMRSGVISEAIGLEYLEKHDPFSAANWFRTARLYYINTEDRLRQDLHLAAIDRVAGRKDLALKGLRDAQIRYGPISESAAITDWLKILDPPPKPMEPKPPKEAKAPKKKPAPVETEAN
jgi:uncharacterized protein (TIGR03790 family)